jgi:hypothetical protein
MKIIYFTDGTKMTFDEYRSQCLRDAEALANHGDFMFRLGRYMAGWMASCASVKVAFAINIFEHGRLWLYALLMASAVVSFVSSLYFRGQAVTKSRECLQRRQNIMDSLYRIERAFEEAEED